jgi:hypothetical protein
MAMELLDRVPHIEITAEALERIMTYYFCTAPEFKMSIISGDLLVNFSQLQKHYNLISAAIYGHVEAPSNYWTYPGGHIDRLHALIQGEYSSQIVRGVVRFRAPIRYVVSMAGTKLSIFTHRITSQGVSKLEPFNPHNSTNVVLLKKGAEIEYNMEGEMAVVK